VAETQYVEVRILGKNVDTALAALAALRAGADGHRVHISPGQRGPYPFRDGRVAFYAAVHVDLAAPAGPPTLPTDGGPA